MVISEVAVLFPASSFDSPAKCVGLASGNLDYHLMPGQIPARGRARRVTPMPFQLGRNASSNGRHSFDDDPGQRAALSIGAGDLVPDSCCHLSEDDRVGIIRLGDG